MTQPVILRLAYLRFVTEIGSSLAETIAVNMKNLQKTIANMQGWSLAFSSTVGRAYGERGKESHKIEPQKPIVCTE